MNDSSSYRCGRTFYLLFQGYAAEETRPSAAWKTCQQGL